MGALVGGEVEAEGRDLQVDGEGEEGGCGAWFWGEAGLETLGDAG